MSILVVGLNHRSAPVEVRERLSRSPERFAGLIEKLVGAEGLREAAILSTCNRLEVLAVGEDEERGTERLLRLLTREAGFAPFEPRHLYRLRREEAVLHVFRVAASLDSMVLGEAQILGQVKEAYRAALEAGTCGPMLNRLFQHAFRAAKRVRTRTGLGSSSISVASIGVQLARELFESLDRKRVLLVGAGEMSESAVDALCHAGAGSVVVANRTLETARRLAERVGGRAVPLDAIDSELLSADVLLCSVQVAEPLLSRARLAGALSGRHGRPLLAIDLGLPRNIEPSASSIEILYLYDLDDLQEIAERGRERRREAVTLAEAIVREELESFEAWRASLPMTPVVRGLVEQARALASEEVAKARQKLEAPEADAGEVIERLGESIVNKLLHGPLVRLRDEAAAGTGLYYADAVRRLFGLEDEEEGED
jgi:glutamyl-tRNA reductase